MKNGFFRLVVGCLTVSFLIAAPSLWAAEKKTMTRQDDFVIIMGSKAKTNIGKPIANMSLFALHNGQAKPIPFQIDEKSPNGDWVLTTAPSSIKGLKPETDEDNGRLDANDQVACMIKDSGDRMDKNLYPQGALAVDEITLTDPLTGGKAWVYLCSFASNPPLSNVSYIKYNTAKDQVETSNYIMGFPARMPIAPGFISINGSPNLIDRMKIRVVAHILGIPYHINENQFVSKLSLYKAGPIRVIRRTKNAIKIFKIFQTPSAAVENIYYGNIASIPIRMTVPLNVAGVAKMFALSVEATGGADFQNMQNWQFKSNVYPHWVTINNSMDQAEKAMNGKGPLDWFCIKGPNKAFMIRITLDRKDDGTPQVLPLTTKLYYVDDAQALDPPEDIPGQTPNVGYIIDGISKLNKGTMYFFATLYLIKDYNDGDEKTYLTIIDKPIRVDSL